jgi:activated CDC42 kinase 1
MLDCDDSQRNRQNLLADVINEVTSMCGLDHKHLIKLYGIVLNSANSLNSMLMMVTEYAPCGSLQDYLRKSKSSEKNLPVKQLFSYVYQIANGMEYLENRKLIHRDLAARNILLFTLEHVKICDFGMTRSVKNYDSGFYTVNESQKIPCAWYPPESIREKLFSIKSDVWAFGVTTWEIFTIGDQPWTRMNAIEILNKIEYEGQRLPKPNLCSKNFYKIVLKCWSANPTDRPSFKDLEHMLQGKKNVSLFAH